MSMTVEPKLTGQQICPKRPSPFSQEVETHGAADDTINVRGTKLFAVVNLL